MEEYNLNAGPEFAVGIHESVTRESAGGRLTDDQLDEVVSSNKQQDLDQFSSAKHFDNCAFAEGALYVAQQWAIIDESDDRLGEDALEAFGRLLHAVQDFYAHSTWVEIHQNQSPIRLWNLVPSSLPAGIVSGTWGLGFPKKCASGTPDHDDLNKDKPDSASGRIVVSAGPNAGRTLHQLARGCAVRASQEQFDRLLRG